MKGGIEWGTSRCKEMEAEDKMRRRGMIARSGELRGDDEESI